MKKSSSFNLSRRNFVATGSAVVATVGFGGIGRAALADGSGMGHQKAAHAHTWQVADELGDLTTPANNALAQSPTGRGAYLLYEAGVSTATMAPEVVADAGSGAAHSNMQPALVVNFVIALQGVFPSRN